MTSSRVEPVETSPTRSLAAKPRRWGSWYVAEHRLRGMRSYYKTLIATTVFTPFIYLFALGLGLGSLVNRGSAGAFDGVNYLTFVAPALIASAACTAAVEECTYPVLMGFKWNPIFFGMNAAPITGNQITNGVFIAVIGRILPTTAVYYLAMLLFGATPSPWSALEIVIATTTGMAFGLVVASYMAGVETDTGQPAIIQRFIVVPLFLFSGTFFPLTQMPIYLQWIGWLSPLWHGSQLGRLATYGLREPGWLVVVHVLFLLGLCVFGWLRTQHVVTKRLNK
jgi:lipooligosaccharide transport system permease protein